MVDGSPVDALEASQRIGVSRGLSQQRSDGLELALRFRHCVVCVVCVAGQEEPFSLG